MCQYRFLPFQWHYFFFRFARKSTFNLLGTFFVARKDTLPPLVVLKETETLFGTFLVALKVTLSRLVLALGIYTTIIALTILSIFCFNYYVFAFLDRMVVSVVSVFSVDEPRYRD